MMDNRNILCKFGFTAIIVFSLITFNAIAEPYYPPLSAQFDTSSFPQDLVASADCDEVAAPGCGASFWDKVRVKDFYLVTKQMLLYSCVPLRRPACPGKQACPTGRAAAEPVPGCRSYY